MSMTDMKRIRFTNEQIIAFIKQAESGMPVKEWYRKDGFSNVNSHKFPAKFGGFDVPDARQMRELERKNAKLNKLLAEPQLDIHALTSVLGWVDAGAAFAHAPAHAL